MSGTSWIPAVLLAATFVALAVSGVEPNDRVTWWLEVAPVLIAVPILVATRRRFPLTMLLYALLFVHGLILILGGHYTYAMVPLGEWMREAFGFSRNNYDKIGHFAFGFFPLFTLREVLLRLTPLRPGGWLSFILVNVILGWAALYEFIEWWSAVLMDPAGGDKFLGTQGYVWDAQSDMLFAGIGACVALFAFAWLHDRSMKRLVEATAATARP